MDKRQTQIAIVVSCVVMVSLLHFAVGYDGTQQLLWHILLDKIYFLSILAGALWFGLSGGLLSALLTVGMYGLHLWFARPIATEDMLHHTGEALNFLVLGVVAGLLVAFERRARERALRMRRRAEREKIASAVAALTETLSARDPTTKEHSQRVADLAAGFAANIGLSGKEVRSIHFAGLLHDIGKIGIPDDILLKTDKLSPEETRKIMEHPAIGEKILAPVGFGKVVEAIATHHENMDGSGYPKGLSEGEIPTSGRVLAIADTYDALSSSRPYKEMLAREEVRGIMDAMAGIKLDLRLLEKFWRYLEKQETGG